MVFWIVLILIGVALICALCVSVIKTKKEREYIRLKAVYREKDRCYDSVICRNMSPIECNERKRIINEYQNAQKELRTFEDNHPRIRYREEDRKTARDVFFVIAGVIGFIALIMTLVIMIRNIGAPEQRVKLEVEGQMIQEALNAGDYEELIAINGTADAFTAAKEYNIKVRGGQVAQDNFWYGIFVPDIYDGLEMVKIPQK